LKTTSGLGRVDPQDADSYEKELQKLTSTAFLGYAVANLEDDTWDTAKIGPWNQRAITDSAMKKILCSFHEEGVLWYTYPMAIAIPSAGLVPGTIVKLCGAMEQWSTSTTGKSNALSSHITIQSIFIIPTLFI
jgi:hypothetical protein